MREFASYYWRVLRTAFWGSLSIASTLGLAVFGLLLPAVIWLFGERGNLSADTTFWLSWSLFATVLGMRLVLAPFEIYRQQKERIAELERQPDIRRDALHGFVQEGIELLNRKLFHAADEAVWMLTVDDWMARLKTALTQFYGAPEASTLTDLVTFDLVKLPDSFSREHNKKRVMLSERIKRLQQRLAR